MSWPISRAAVLVGVLVGVVISVSPTAPLLKQLGGLRKKGIDISPPTEGELASIVAVVCGEPCRSQRSRSTRPRYALPMF